MAAPAARPQAPQLAAVALTALVVAAATWFVPRLVVRSPAPAAARFEVNAPKGHEVFADGGAAVISPDGRTLAVYVDDSAGDRSIWIRRLDSLVPRRLPGTEGASCPFWSPDGRFIAFFTGDQRLSKIAIDGGTAERICETRSARGGAWSRDGVILLAPYSNGGIFRVSANGGPLVQVTHPDSARGVTGHRFPVFLPDGKHFLFSSVPAGADGKGGLCVGSLDGGETRELARLETGAVYAAPGWLVTTRGGALVAYRFDARALRLAGEPVVIGDALVGSAFSGGPIVSASSSGTLAFLSRADVTRRLAWIDILDGRESGAPPVAPGLYERVQLSHDDRRAAIVVATEPTRSDVVTADLERGVVTRLTQAPENATVGRWSPDGTRIAYIDETTETIRIRSLVDGTLRTFLEDDRSYKRLSGWSPDGRGLIYERLDAVTKWDIWLLPVEGDSTPRPVIRTPANDTGASTSTDGRWIAFQCDESGPTELCVQPYLAPGTRYQVTIGGGAGGWSRKGVRLFFGNAKEPGVIRAGEVRPGPEFALGPATVVGRQREDMGSFDVSLDDRRFLGILPAEKAPPQTATILQNWTLAIRKP